LTGGCGGGKGCGDGLGIMGGGAGGDEGSGRSSCGTCTRTMRIGYMATK
jgi:hypothetical protein